LGAALQSIRHAGSRRLRRKRRADRRRSAQAHEGNGQQVGLSRSERAANVQGAFRVPPEGKAAVVGRGLILVDDVLTKVVRGRCRAPAPPMWTYWSSPGLPTRCERPYKGLI
jgi:hypothetical protein